MLSPKGKALILSCLQERLIRLTGFLQDLRASEDYLADLMNDIAHVNAVIRTVDGMAVKMPPGAE